MNIVDIVEEYAKVKKTISIDDTTTSALGTAVSKLASAEGSTNGLAKGLNAVSKAFDVSSASVLKFAGIAGVSIAGVSLAVQAYKNHWEELNKQADAASESYQNTVSSIEEYKTQISSLKSSLDNGNLSEEEAYNVRAQLLTIQDELIEKYGLETDALNILGDAVDATNEKLDGISRSEALRNIDENQKAYENAAKKMEKIWDRRVILGNVSNDEGFMSELDEFLSSYDDVLKIIEQPNGSPVIRVTGDTTEAYDALNDLYDFILDYGDEFADASITGDAIKNTAKNLLNEVGSIFDEYHDRYESYMIQSIAADPEASGIMDTIEGYISAIQTAVSSCDWS